MPKPSQPKPSNQITNKLSHVADQLPPKLYTAPLPKPPDKLVHSQLIDITDKESHGFQYLSFWYTNVEFLKNKFNEFKIRVWEDRPQCIAVVETALQPDVNSPNFYPTEALEIEGYVIHRKDNTKEIRGGILVYIDENIQTSEVYCKQLKNISSETQENLLLNLKINDANILFGTFYRKGKSGFKNATNLRNLISTVAENYDKVVLCGDFNLPKIDWANNKVQDTPLSESVRFYDCLLDNYLTQHVTEPTRQRGSDEPSLLDLIITEDGQTQISPSLSIEPGLGKSDHFVLKWNYLIDVEDTPTHPDVAMKPRLNYHKGNYKMFRAKCQNIDWMEVLKPHGEASDLDNMVENFYNKIKDIEKETIPEYTGAHKTKKKAPWMDKACLKAVKRKYHSWKRYQSSRSYQKYKSYIKERDKTAKKIRQAKDDYEAKIAKECKANPKVFFKYSNFKQKKHKNHIRLYKEEGSKILAGTDTENADILNMFYKTVFTKEDDTPEMILNSSAQTLYEEDIPDPLDFTGKEPDSLLDSFTMISKEELKDILKDIDASKSSSDLCIHPRILKEAPDELTEPLYQIFKTSFEQSKVPTIWKTGFITPIHKGGDRHHSGNYRPITITSVICRVLEKIVKANIMNHVTKNNLLSNKQHGFVSGRSCLTNLLETMEYITKLTDLGVPVDEIFLDFSKAFDKVPHQRLLFKLHKYGITGQSLSWIESFLSDRSQQVKIRDSLSKPIKVTSGVPQGSILGPILFLMYINDLPGILSTENNVFADDTKLFNKIQYVEDASKLQEDLNKVVEWCEKWGMVLNSQKCHVMHYGTRNRKYFYHINGKLLDPSVAEKDLGILMSNDLKPNEHLTMCIKKANTAVGMLKRTFNNMTKDIFIKVYPVYVRPILEYCQEVWSPHLQQDIIEIENVQRRATKMVIGLNDMDYEDRLKTLGLYKLSERRLRGDMITVYKLINNLFNINHNTFFQLNSAINNNMNTRSHAKQIMLPKITDVNNDTRRNFFSQRIIVPWNSLPPMVVNSPSIDSFKRNYDNHVLKFYMPSEKIGGHVKNQN